MKIEEAKKLLEEDQKKREKECSEAIEKALKDFNCKADIVVGIRDDRVYKVLKIIAN